MKIIKRIICLVVMLTAGSFNLLSLHGQTFLTNGLISYYPFNGNANDAVGTNNGTVNGAVLTTDRFGTPNSAYLFNSQSESYISLPGTAVNNLAQGTITAWVELNGNTNEIILAKQHNSVNTYDVLSVGTQVRPEVGQLPVVPGQVYYHSANYTPAVSSSNFLSTGLWYHVAVVFSATSCILYINGSPSVTVSGNFSLPNDPTGTATAIGSWQSSTGSSYFDGKIDELRIYNRPLASNELAEMYAITASNLPRIATGVATATNGFVINVNITDPGLGYTNTPLVRFIGGGGTGAQAVAVISNGVVTGINVVSAGSGYTSAPTVVIDPPFVFNPILGIAPMTLLSFSNLTVGTAYQLQQLTGWYWANQSASFTASNALYTNLVAGVVAPASFRLAISPPPAQAFATPQVVNGFVVGATLTSGGSGYVTVPAVSITDFSGSNATAVAQISGGVVTNISITSAGIGYSATPLIEIGQPPTASVSPVTLPVMRIDSSNLVPYDNYQIQFTPAIGRTWQNWNGGLFTTTAVTNSQFLFITNGTGFFRSIYAP